MCKICKNVLFYVTSLAMVQIAPTRSQRGIFSFGIGLSVAGFAANAQTRWLLATKKHFRRI